MPTCSSHVETASDSAVARSHGRGRVRPRQRDERGGHEYLGRSIGPDGRGSGGGSPLDEGAFGDLGVLCKRRPPRTSEAPSSTDPGVTADSIQVWTFADPGFQGRPGPEPGAVRHRRGVHQVVQRPRWHQRPQDRAQGARLDAHRVPAARIEACDQGDFFIVGGGAVFDDTGQATASAARCRRSPASRSRPRRPSPTCRCSRSRTRRSIYRSASSAIYSEKFPGTTQTRRCFHRCRRLRSSPSATRKRCRERAKIVYEGTYNATARRAGGRSSSDAQPGVKGLYWAGEPAKLSTLLAEAASLDI